MQDEQRNAGLDALRSKARDQMRYPKVVRARWRIESYRYRLVRVWERLTGRWR